MKMNSLSMFSPTPARRDSRRETNYFCNHQMKNPREDRFVSKVGDFDILTEEEFASKKIDDLDDIPVVGEDGKKPSTDELPNPRSHHA